MATAGDRHMHSKAEAEWQQALELEKKLKAVYRKRSFYDPEARNLRGQLRNSYEALLFIDAAFAAANDVELALWRAVFYRPIEEFRSRLKQAEKAGEVGATQIPKVAVAFVKFLEEASLFYRRLIMQLQAVYGDVGVKLDVPKEAVAAATAGRAAGATNGAGPMQSSASSSAPRDVRPSIHRCLIYLGDLSRYMAQAAPKTAAAAVPQQQQHHPAARPDWIKAAHYYRLAARVLPRSGNPHNQLAVMAVMTNDELRAVYHYARSLCVGIPFQTAKENLMLLFEQNRQRYAQYAQRQQQQQRQLSPAQLLADLSVCYVRVSGLFFDRINQYEYPNISSNAVAALAAFTGHASLIDIMQRQPRADCTPLHLVVLGVFAVHSSSAAPAEGRSTAAAAGVGFADAAQRGQQRSRALATLYKTGRLLCQAGATACNAVAASAGAAANGSNSTAGQEWKGTACLLVSVNVLFHWLAAQPIYAGIQINSATDDEVKSRATFWTAAAQLITAAAAAYPSSRAAAAAAGGQQQQQGSGSGGGDSDGGALPEELELLGFEPLRSKHYFHVTDVGKLAADEPATRTCRMLAAARVVSGHLSTSEQQQLIRQYSTAAAAGSNAVQPQTMRQLATGVQKFVTAVAEVAAGAAAVRSAAAGATTAAAAPGDQAAGEAMDVDLPLNQQQQVDDEQEEEVIVFKPRPSRLSAMSEDTAPAAAAAPAGGTFTAAAAPAAAATAAARTSPRPFMLPTRVPLPSVVAAAAAEPPPLPQQLLASRQQQQGCGSVSSSQAASGVSSPTGTASPQRPASYAAVGQQQQLGLQQVTPLQLPQQQLDAHTATDSQLLPAGPPGSAVAGRITPPATASPAAAAGASGLLHGHAATALDLQQAQAASDALLARLTSRQSGLPTAMNPSTAPPISAPLGFGGLSGPGGSGPGGLAPSGLGLSSNLPPQVPGGYWSSGGASGGSVAGLTGSGGFSRSVLSGLGNQGGMINPNPVSGLGLNPQGNGAQGPGANVLRTQPASPAVFGGAANAAEAAAGLAGSPRISLSATSAQQQQHGGLPSGTFSASGVRHSRGPSLTMIGGSVLGGVQHSRGPSMDTLGLSTGLGFGLGAQNPSDGFEGFDPLGFGLSSAMNSQGFAGVADPAVGGIAFDDQLLLGLGGSLGPAAQPISILQPQSPGQQQQQHSADSRAAYQLEQTARAAADSILSPEVKQGPALMQRHQQQRQQLQYTAGATAQQALADAAAAADAVAAQALAAASGLAGSGKVVDLLPQQQQQPRRFSGDPYSPSAQHAIGFGRGPHAFQQQQQLLATSSAPPSVIQDGVAAAAAGDGSSIPSSPSALAAAAAAGGASVPGLERPGSYTMFSGPDLFAAAEVPSLSAAAVQERQRRISSSSMTGSQSSHQGTAPVTRPVPPPLEQQMQQQVIQQQLLQQQGVRQPHAAVAAPLAVAAPSSFDPQQQQQQQGEGLGPCDSPTSPVGLTLLDYLADQQRKTQAAAADSNPHQLGLNSGLSHPPGFTNPPGYKFGSHQTSDLPYQQQQQGGFEGLLGPGMGLAGPTAAGGVLFGGSPEVLLPPVDVGQSQNPFAS